MRNVASPLALAAATLCLLVSAQPARAWYRGGVYFGFTPFLAPPVVLPPPAYYPPPYYPPPVYYAPPQVYAAPQAPTAAQQCFAASFSCPLTAPAYVGGTCSCPAGSGRIFGRAG